MRIAICDDKKIITSMLKRIVDDILKRRNISALVDEFWSGEELLKEIQEYDAVFLDMDMPGMDGIITGKLIMEKNRDCIIIMATGREDRYREAFHINARDFITKPFDEGNIEEALDIIIDGQMGKEPISLYKNGINYNIRQKDILYIEAYDGYIQCFTTSGMFRSEISLTQVMQEVDGRMFYRVRRGMAVNMMWVDKYDKGKIHIGDKDIEPSRANKKQFEKAYIEFDLKYR